MNPLGEDQKCHHCDGTSHITAERHQLVAGTVLHNRYLLGHALGHGGFGITYIGRDLVLDQRVAVKEYFPSSFATRDISLSLDITVSGEQQRELLAKGKSKMLSEAQVLARLSNVDGVVHVQDFFEENNTAYIVMEYLEGKDLRSVLFTKTFSAEETLRMMLPVIESLELVHEQNVIHRDISPDNIMQLDSGALKLMDFGAARDAVPEDDASVSVVLKAGYAPAEQYFRRGNQGPWTDIYALCATMMKCITGKTPPDALQRLDMDTIQWPSQQKIRISAKQEKILKKGLELKPEDRYQNLGELRRDIEQAIKMPKERRKKSKKEKALRLVALSAGGIAIAAILGLWGVPAYLHSPQYLEKQVEKGTYTHVLFSADENTTLKDYSSDKEILLERLESFAGENKVTLHEDGDRYYQVYFPTEAFGDTDPDRVIRDWLAPCGRFYFTHMEFSDAQLSPVLLEPKYIDRISVKSGPLGDKDVSEFEFEDEDSFQYLKVTLNSAGKEHYQSVFKDFGTQIGIIGDVFHLSQTAEQDRSHYYQVRFPRDRSTFYIAPLKDETFPESISLLKHMLKQDAMSGHLNYSLEHSIKWESGDTDDAGELQCGVDDLKHSDLLLICRPQETSEEPTKGEKLDTISSLKKRLDSLGLPYTFGTVPGYDDSVAVKTSWDHLNPLLLQMLVSNHFNPSLEIGNFRYDLLNDDTVESIIQEDGSSALHVQLNGSLRLEEIQNIFTNNPDAIVTYSVKYGMMSRCPVVYGKIRDIYDPETMSFNFQHTDLSDGEITEKEAEWFFSFLAALFQTNKQIYRNYDYYLGNGSEKLGYAGSYAFSDQDGLKSLRSKIQSIIHTADVYVIDDIYAHSSELHVALHLPVDETLPEEALNEARQIFETIDLSRTMYDTMIIHLTDEDESAGEQAYVKFTRNYFFGTEEEGKDIFPISYSASGAFYNGRLERYKDEFRSLLLQSEFYVTLGKNYQNYQNLGFSGWVFAKYVI